MEGIIMAETERLSWQEICKKYPNQKVAIAEPEWENMATIKSGIVKYSESDGYSRMEIRSLVINSKGQLHAKGTTGLSSFVGLVDV
jgi:hypothetical protein